MFSQVGGYSPPLSSYRNRPACLFLWTAWSTPAPLSAPPPPLFLSLPLPLHGEKPRRGGAICFTLYLVVLTLPEILPSPLSHWEL